MPKRRNSAGSRLSPAAVVFALLVIATLAAFAYAQRVKRDPLLVDRVTFGTKEYAGSARWIILSQPGYTIFAESPAGTPGAAAKPPTGLGLSEGDMEELHTLVGNGLPVTILP